MTVNTPFLKSPLRDGQYFLHPFRPHQPDLDHETSAVREEVPTALRFWPDPGIDGFRLDAVPYLYASAGTNCENRPATHHFLKRVRKEIDAMCPDTVLLAEANQWPQDVVDHFGGFRSGGDDCPMAFRFPAIGELPYLLTLAGHGSYWFRLSRVAPHARRGR